MSLICEIFDSNSLLRWCYGWVNPSICEVIIILQTCARSKNTCVPMFSLMLTPLSLHTVYIWWKCCVGSHATKVNGNKYDGAGRQTTDYWQPDIFQQHGYYCLNGYIHITWEDQSDCTDWVKCNQHCMLELPKFNQERDHVNWEIICRTDT